MVQTASLLKSTQVGETVQPNCLKGHIVCENVYRDMHFKGLSDFKGPGFLSSATWPSMHKTYSNLLIINQSNKIRFYIAML